MYLVDSVIHTSNSRSQVYKKGICQQIFKGNMAGLVQKIIFISDILALFELPFFPSLFCLHLNSRVFPNTAANRKPRSFSFFFFISP